MKHIVLSTLALACSLCCNAQGTIEGNISNLDDGTVYLEFGRGIQDSCQSNNGRFKLNIPAFKGAEYGTVRSANGKWGGMFWLMSNNNITITSKTGGKAELLGSPVEDDYQAYNAHLDSIRNVERACVAKQKEALKKGDMELINSNKEYFDKVLKVQEDSIFMIFARKQPRSYVVLNHIYNCRVLQKYDFDRYMAMAAVLDTTAFEGEQWKTFCRLVAEDKALRPGQPMPEIVQPDMWGTKFSTTQMRGKYLLYTITNSDCKEYQGDLAMRQRVYKQKAGWLEMIDWLFSNSETGVLQQTALGQTPWIVVGDYKGFMSKQALDLHIDHIPLNFLVSPDGTIIARDVFGAELEKALEQVK